MAKFDDDLFEDVEYTAPEDMDDSLFEDEPVEEMSQLEAGVRGAAQGLTFDFADEIAGAAQAGVGALQGEEGSLSELYKKYRDEQRRQMEQASEEFPVTYYGSDVAAGVLPALLTGGATAAASVGKAVAKGATKGALKESAKQAAKVGAKVGAATGLGASEAETLPEMAQDVAVGGALGAGLGAVTPLASKVISKAGSGVKKAGEAVSEFIPGAEAIELGYKAGKKGIKLSEEGIRGSIKEYSEKLHKDIVKKMTKEGLDKKRAIEIADDIGVRIDAGESVQNVMDELVEKGAMGLKDAKEKAAFFNVLDDLVQGNDQNIKALKKLESKLAKDVAKDKYNFGAETIQTRETSDQISELLPLPDQKGEIKGLRAKMRIPARDGDEPIEYFKQQFQEILESPIKLQQVDLTSMKPSQTEDLIQYLNSFTGDLTRPAKNITEKTARRLAGEIREKSNQALESGMVSDKNQSISNLFKALRKVGIKDRLGGSEERVMDQIDAIRKKISASGESAEIDKERLFGYLRKAGPELEQSASEGEFLNRLSELSGMTGGVRTTNLKGLLGTAEGAVAKGANITGRTVRVISQKAQPKVEKVSKVANKIGDYTEDQLQLFSSKMAGSENAGIQAMGRQLQDALAQDATTKNALIWSLSQQPAFRKSVQNIIGDIEQQGSEELEFERGELNKALFPTTQESEQRNPFPRSEEKELENTRKPSSVEPVEENLDDMSFEDAFNAHYEKVKNLHVEERPNLSWKGGEYKAIKAGERSKPIKEETSVEDRKKRIYEGLIERGLDHDNALAIMANIGHETGGTYNPSTKQIGVGKVSDEDWWKKTKAGRGTGLVQWDGSRRTDLKKFAEDKGKSWDDMDTQLDFLMHELQGSEKGAYEKLKEAESLEDKTETFMKRFERPGKPHLEERQEYLKGLIEDFQKNLTRHEKYIGTGGQALYSSTGDDLMGTIDKLPMSEEEKDIANDAVVEGDIPKLRELLNQYKGIMS